MLTDKLKAVLGDLGITFIGQNTGQNTSNSNTLNILSVAGVQAGDLLIAFLASDQIPTYSSTPGWTEVYDANGFCIKYKIASSADGSGSFGVSTSTSILTGSIVAFRGATYDALGAFVEGITFSLTAAAVSASTEDCVLLAFVTKDVASRSVSVTGMDSISANTGTTIPSWAVFMEQLTNSGSTGTRSVSVGASNEYGSVIMLTIKPA